ncbi:MAG: hypothetical protein ACHBN1_18550 [Heteroscytonema crispum UTEX LB 1556]
MQKSIGYSFNLQTETIRKFDDFCRWGGGSACFCDRCWASGIFLTANSAIAFNLLFANIC